MDEPPDRGDLDPRTAEAVEQAYAERVELDTAARHLWVLYRSAGAVETARATEGGGEQPPGDGPSEGGSGRQVARMRHVALSVLTGVALLATSGAAVAASGSALPGDTLYALKRGTEQVRLVIATGSGTEAQMRVELARERWTEAKRVAADRPDLVPDLVRDAVESLEAAERGGGPAVEEAGSLRRQLVDESPRVAADLDDRAREDVRTSMSRLAGSDTAGAVEGNGGRDGVTTTQLPEPGVDDRTATPSSPRGEGGTVETDDDPEPPDRAGEEGGDAEDSPGAADGDGKPPDESREGDGQGVAEAPGAEGDTTADVAEEALGADEMAVDEEGVPPEDEELSADEEDVPPEGEEAPADEEGTPRAEEEGLDLRDDAPRQRVRGGSAGRDVSDREASTGADRQAGEAAGEGAAPHSSPTLSPDPTQQHVSGASGG